MGGGVSEMTVTTRPDGVVLRERSRGAVAIAEFMPTDDNVKDHIEERLYTCPNGWSLGARRGGRLHMAGECPAHPDGAGTWEVFTLDPRGVACGGAIGYIGEEQLERLVIRLRDWWVAA